MDKYLVLVEDSVFDNQAYVARGKAVVEHLCEPSPWLAQSSSIGSMDSSWT